MPQEQSLDADVLVEIGPMDSLATADDVPVGPLPTVAVKESWIPAERHGDRPAIL